MTQEKPSTFPLFAISAPGLEAYTAMELQQLDLLEPNRRSSQVIAGKSNFIQDESIGGVSFQGDRRSLYLANLWLHTANRVLVRLGEFYAAAFSELRKKASRLPWENYLLPGQAISLRVSCHKSKLYHSDAVAERVAGAISDRLGRSMRVVKYNETGSNPGSQLILVRLVHDQCTISLDSSGALLNRRGYRLAVAKAPLRETLAAGMLLGSAWDSVSPLLDPFCGSGVIPIEAALLALHKAPALAALPLETDLKAYAGKAKDKISAVTEANSEPRRFAFMEWPDFDRKLWQSLKETALFQHQMQAQKLAGKLRIQASDRDAGAVAMAQTNAARAGVAEWIEFRCQSVSAIQPPVGEVGWLVTNPPYGMRLSPSKDLRNLYAQIGNVLREKCPGWHVAILCSELPLLMGTGIKLDTSLSMDNGGVRVRLGRGVV